CELDFLDTDDKYSSDFKLSLDLVVSPQDKPLVDGPPPWDGFQARPRLLVSEDEELAKLRADFMRDGEAPPLASPVSSQDSPLADNEPAAPAAAAAAAAAAAPPKPQREGGSSFFDTLDWQHLEEPAPSAQPPISEPQQQRDDGPRDYEAEALRAAHEKPSGIAPRPKPRGGADCLAAVLAISSRTGRPIWSNPRRLTTSLLGWPTCWDLAAARRWRSNGGLSPAASSASLRQTQSNADLLSDLFSSAPAPAAASADDGNRARRLYVVDDFSASEFHSGAGPNRTCLTLAPTGEGNLEFDPFAPIGGQQQQKPPHSAKAAASAKARSSKPPKPQPSRPPLPSAGQQQQSKPNYSRFKFLSTAAPASSSSSFGAGSGVCGYFDDLLKGAGHGNFVGGRAKISAKSAQSATRCGTRPGRSLWTRSGQPGVAGKSETVRVCSARMQHGSVGGCRWTPVSHGRPGVGDQVNRKACLAVHPDNGAGTQQRGLLQSLSSLELNDAWSAAFEESGMKSLYEAGGAHSPPPNRKIHHRILISLSQNWEEFKKFIIFLVQSMRFQKALRFCSCLPGAFWRALAEAHVRQPGKLTGTRGSSLGSSDHTQSKPIT
uniref:J domain-containing protein n=1 Tax=Macrostomum lignano TaxID=282301 RepID=A0A1I8F8S5_9PLAT